MGQALRRAAGRIRPSSSIEMTSAKPKTVVVDKRPPPLGPTESAEISKAGDALNSGI